MTIRSPEESGPRSELLIIARPDGGGARYWLLGLNPAAKVIAALVLSFGLIPAIDPVTGGIVLAAALLLVPFSGLDRRTTLILGVPFVLMGCSNFLVNYLYGEYGAWGALGSMLRLLAIALPGLLAAISSDPTKLTDALIQKLKVPERPALSVLAALRLLPLLAGQWNTISLARRARGIDAGRNPFAATRVFVGKTFALLVRAIRTGTLLSTAMEARAFGTGPRSHARASHWRAADTLVIVGAFLLLAAAYTVSARLGTLTFLFGGVA
ncbi:energy-coupling factor transporter transmembrane component T family protein [Nocardiopsis ansamitocini]|uniref:ABC transporter n=1 Tax=Nocardiopsis ansamitocini TaxID=1670832 RepID=A0A9W6P3Z5_9ACTN|nr:energy-coupling factor transporter transmembrane component T [Nocardiopsis ansamitocini]GLU46674.1 ABC transporter [Nocardiopsis ansamitocini]